MKVRADCGSLTSRAGTALLVGVADRIGLTGALVEALSDLRGRRGRHRPGGVARDLAVMLADGGDALCDLGALRDQEVLFGPVASDATAWRLIAALDEERLAKVREARATARRRVWELAEPPKRMILDIDATLVTAHSEKEGAAGTYKRGFGFHPLLCFEATSGEALAGVLRPGNAGSNTASDHIEVLTRALLQLPAGAVNPGTLVRADSGGATHALIDAVVGAGLCFSVGFDLTEPVRRAILSVPESAWVPALGAEGGPRDGAWVSELTLDLEAAGWPRGTRALCRRERPHPGAQLSFSDAQGYRFQVFITNQRGRRIARLEQVHRSRAAVEDSIRCAKASGLRNLPFRAFAHNAAWLELVLLGYDLVAWTKALLLDGELARCEPKRLRYRLFHVAGRIVSHARRITLRLPRSWPWADALLRAFARLQALPAG
ncbi:MAG: IS1380 family transposase [Actinobacteria bacterium]|nr:IS1380 family transposase [Actinomycetota bacterium]